MKLRLLVIFLTLASVGVALPPAQDAKPAPLTTPEIVVRASPAVVTIFTPTNQGSGVIIDSSGIVATSLHVVRNDTTAMIRLANGEAYDDVRVVDVDARKDLVLLKVKGEKFRAIDLGDSEALQVGDPIVAIGSPLGFSQTVSQGIVSAKRQADGYWEIQTTAAVSHGSSGGGLFDTRGRLIGLTYRGLEEGANVSFAVPTNYLRPMLLARDTYALSELKARLPPLATYFGPALNDLSSVPQLSNIYVNRKGTLALIEQRGPRLRVTFRSVAGEVTGHAEFGWNQGLEAFDGTATATVTCGKRSKHPRTPDAPLKFPQLFAISATILRTRWLYPDAFDCARGVVNFSSWQEEIWTTPSRGAL